MTFFGEKFIDARLKWSIYNKEFNAIFLNSYEVRALSDW